MAEEARQRLVVEAKAEGVAEVSDRLNDLLLTEALFGGAAAEAAKGQGQVNLSLHDFQDAMRLIDPQLAGITRRFLNFATAFGDLGKASLGEVFERIAGGVGKLGDSFKLLLAGGGAAAGILAIIEVVRGLREEMERATASIAKQIEAMTELEKHRLGRAAGIEQLSALRREGPLSAEESERMNQAVEGVLSRVPASTDAERKRLEEAAASAAVIAGVEGGEERIDRLSVLLATRPDIDVERLAKRGPEARGAAVDRLLAKHAAAIDVVLERERIQAGAETEARAVSERAQAGAVGEANIEEFIRGLPGHGFEGRDLGKIAQIAGRLPSISEEDITSAMASWENLAFGETLSDEFRRVHLRKIALQRRGIEGITEEDVRLGEFVGQQLRRPRSGGGVTIIDNRNAKFVGPSARAQREASRSGESLAVQGERN